MADERFLDWLSGFVDGEGHFQIRHGHTGVQFLTGFTIDLRADDVGILLEIQAQLQMGRVYRKIGDKYPLTRIDVNRKADCLRLVAIFDKHPLRAKKQKDYKVWREAVLENQKPPAKRNLAKMQFLFEKIRLVRRFEDEQEIDLFLEPEAPVPESVQCCLFPPALVDSEEVRTDD